MFLVGGLGTNKYLYQFLSQRLGREIDVKQPESGYSLQIIPLTSFVDIVLS